MLVGSIRPALLLSMDIPSTIFNQAIANGMPALLSQFIVGQSAHETDGWTSAIFTDCYNCFGYKWIGQSTAAGPCLYHPAYAAYYTIAQSVSEMTGYIKRRQLDGSFPQNLNSITTALQYATLLKNAAPGEYFEDPLSVYSNGISSWLRQLNFSTVVKTGGGILVVGGLLVWIFRKRLFSSNH